MIGRLSGLNSDTFFMSIINICPMFCGGGISNIMCITLQRKLHNDIGKTSDESLIKNNKLYFYSNFFTLSFVRFNFFSNIT
jgi:hypothetical protein